MAARVAEQHAWTEADLKLVAAIVREHGPASTRAQICERVIAVIPGLRSHDQVLGAMRRLGLGVGHLRLAPPPTPAHEAAARRLRAGEHWRKVAAELAPHMKPDAFRMAVRRHMDAGRL